MPQGKYIARVKGGYRRAAISHRRSRYIAFYKHPDKFQFEMPFTLTTSVIPRSNDEESQSNLWDSSPSVQNDSSKQIPLSYGFLSQAIRPLHCFSSFEKILARKICSVDKRPHNDFLSLCGFFRSCRANRNHIGICDSSYSFGMTV